MSTTSDSESGCQRVEDLWFSDADLILRAEKAIFRVYGGFLAARSSVFRDMLSFPQPQTTGTQTEEETIDGHTIIRLHDEATEAEAFLRAVFDSSFFMPPPNPVKLDTVIGVLRLAHKYDVQYLFRRALAHLEVLYPFDLASLYAGGSLAAFSTHVQFEGWSEPAANTLQAVSEVGATWMLPSVYYAIAHVDEFWVYTSEYLEGEQLEKCLVGHSHFIRAHTSSHRFLHALPLASCNFTACRVTVAGAYRRLNRRTDLCQDAEPLREWVFDSMNDELCSACSDFGAARHVEAQEAFWESLPSLFQLPAWEKLMEMRQKVMTDTA
ncbi:BTB domain-containing protein [Favolaschia claudopus]|uniref:BTB domain-containing protein n=1 Tax=Favolaschia claudopus TaxID=2862362 RepID=A0AAV9ZSB7_9AGAR